MQEAGKISLFENFNWIQRGKMKVLYWKNPLVLAYPFFVCKIIQSFVVCFFVCKYSQYYDINWQVSKILVATYTAIPILLIYFEIDLIIKYRLFHICLYSCPRSESYSIKWRGTTINFEYEEKCAIELYSMVYKLQKTLFLDIALRHSLFISKERRKYHCSRYCFWEYAIQIWHPWMHSAKIRIRCR